MEIACVVDCRLAAPQRPGRSGGPRPGREIVLDPVEVEELGEAMARALEGIGAGVEMGRIGEMFFSVGGLRGLYGGEVAGVTATARRALEMACGGGARRGAEMSCWGAEGEAGRSPQVPCGTGADAGRLVGEGLSYGAAEEGLGTAGGPVDPGGMPGRAGDHAACARDLAGRGEMSGRAVGHAAAGRRPTDREEVTRPGLGHAAGVRPDRGGKTMQMPGRAVYHADGAGHPDGPGGVTARTADMTFGRAAGAGRSAEVSDEEGGPGRRTEVLEGGATRGAVLIGVAPTRTAARAAAERGELVVTRGRLANFLGGLPAAVLLDRLGEARRAEELVASLERLGIGTLGRLRRLSTDQVADRFGPLGLRALGIARGEEAPLRPRVPYEDLVEEIELPEGVAGSQLDRALELLVDRLLAAPGRKGRTLLGVRLGARLCGGGSWSVDQGLGRPSAAAGVLRRLLVPRLAELPGPAEALRLRALGFGPPAADQLVMEVGGSEPRRRRVGAAVREVRAAQGADALLRVLPVDAASRVPERRHLLTPFPEV